jgi:hypothetical protein
VFTRFLVQNAGEQYAECTEFANSTCRFRAIAGGTGLKLWCRGGTLDPTCAAN